MSGKEWGLLGAALAAVAGGIVVWWMCKNWNQIVYDITAWARKKNYRRVLRFMCKIEKVRSVIHRVHRVTISFLGRKGDRECDNPPIVTTNYITEEELRAKLGQTTGSRVLELTV